MSSRDDAPPAAAVAAAVTATSYRYLRLAMVLVLTMLAVAVVLEWRRPSASSYVVADGLLDSVSAYYWTAVRPVFVAALVALGVGMIALRPETELEDLLLDVAGALAPLVAFVPTPLPDDCLARGSAAGCALPADVVASVSNNVTAYLAAGSLALAVHAAVTWSSRHPKEAQAASTTRRLRFVAGAVLGSGVVGAGLWLHLGPGSFGRHAHAVAAVPLFVCIVGVVLLNAVSASAHRRRALPADGSPTMRERVCPGLYWTLLVVMLGGVATAGVLALLGVTTRGVLVAEVAVLGPFLLFWIVQTVELWEVEDRPGVLDRGRVWPYGRDGFPWMRRRQVSPLS